MNFRGNRLEKYLSMGNSLLKGSMKTESRVLVFLDVS